jgi:hypothetical protein
LQPTDDELRFDGYFAPFPSDEARQITRLIARRHEVDDRRGAGARFDVGFTNERAVSIAARYSRALVDRRDRSMAVFGGAGQRRETDARVETGPA